MDTTKETISVEVSNLKNEKGDIVRREHSSPKLRRAVQGVPSHTVSAKDDHHKGPDFEHWAQNEVFCGQGRRLTVHAEDNKHLRELGGLEETIRRQSDSFVSVRGDIFEFKSGYLNGGIDQNQVRDYAIMRDAGFVYERQGDQQSTKQTKIRDVYYVFDSKLGAEANRSVLEDNSFFILYRNEDGELEQLK